MRDDRALLGEALDVLGLLGEEGARDEEREVGVLVARLLEAPVEVVPDRLPDAVAVGPDDHAPADGRVVHELARLDDVQVPLAVVLGARRDRLLRVLTLLVLGLLAHGELPGDDRKPQAPGET